jgi:hypothetical protein
VRRNLNIVLNLLYISPTHQTFPIPENDSEVEAAWQWLKTKFPAAHRIFPEQIPAHGHNFVLWWHEIVVSSQWSVVSWKLLRRFLQSGGRLFLSLAAVQAVVPLGLEKEWPDISEAGNYDPQSKPAHEWIAPQGFELRGLMGFLAHLPSNEHHSLSPLSSLSQLRTSDFGHFSGIYLWNAKAGAPCWRYGYGPSKWPRGKVWGMHRYYIGFDPAQKLAWAYENRKCSALALISISRMHKIFFVPTSKCLPKLVCNNF